MAPNNGSQPNVPVLEVTNLHKSFGHREVLRGISLSLRWGEVVAVIGRSGSGKSTLLRCISGLEPFQSGEIHVAGEEVVARSHWMRRRRHEVGLIFQTFNLFPHLSALRNITLAPLHVKGMSPTDAEALGVSLLARVGLEDRAADLPRELSGGEQQRVAIARALAMSPRVMLFDEPTSALDPETVGSVLGVIRDLATDGMSMLIVTHEMRFARDIAGRVLFVEGGVVAEEGTAAALLEEPRDPRTRAFLTAVLHK